MGATSRRKGKTLCECGCGNPAPLAPYTARTRGWVGGEPLRFVHGHNGRALRYEVRDCGYATPCWIFSNGGDRYGRIRRDGKQYPAHRFMYEQRVGPIPAGLTLDHLCRVKRCINPAHLEPVTQTENLRRAMKLTPDEVAEIRAEGERLKHQGRRRPKGSRVIVARRYGVDVKTIYNIWAGATWAE